MLAISIPFPTLSTQTLGALCIMVSVSGNSVSAMLRHRIRCWGLFPAFCCGLLLETHLLRHRRSWPIWSQYGPKSQMSSCNQLAWCFPGKLQWPVRSFIQSFICSTCSMVFRRCRNPIAGLACCERPPTILHAQLQTASTSMVHVMSCVQLVFNLCFHQRAI